MFLYGQITRSGRVPARSTKGRDSGGQELGSDCGGPAPRGGVSRAAARWPGEDVRALPPQASGLVLCSLRWTPQLPAGLGRENEGQGQMSRERTCGQQGETRPAATWPSRGPSHQHRGALGSGLLPCTDGALRSQAQHCAGRHLLGVRRGPQYPPLAPITCSRKTGLCWEGFQSLSLSEFPPLLGR